ncbi:epidermal growth factor 7 [Labeo rohita]|uniref:Epidermal growth factor 7 n=1 Tax=Labeo rohita TaxID=84645 RepID=A0A498NNM4_LABRO|nr:epidermal growth factor 7 [Labeo rohita]
MATSSARDHVILLTGTESFLQPVHKPYITMCQNHRMCSTYKTIYRVSYRQRCVSSLVQTEARVKDLITVHVRKDGWDDIVKQDGFSLAEDEITCSRIPAPSPSPAGPPKADDRSSKSHAGGGLGLGENVTEEVQILKNRVELLEQKLEMVLAPFTTLFPLDGVGDTNSFLPERTNFLSHSLQQLDRIDSLSEQVGFLEERIGACACQEN